MPANRAWRAVTQHAADALRRPARLRVVSYNVLAQGLVKRELFPYASASALRWKTRSAALLRELDALPLAEVDVVCLQECDRFAAFWEPAMRVRGFAGLFAQRPKERDDADGCAIFFRTARLALAAAPTVVQYDDEVADDHQLHLATRNIAQIVQLAVTAAPGAPIITVVNTHLHWRPHYNYLRLRQAHRLLRTLHALAPAHVVLCGDLNTNPDDALYELLVRGQVTPGPPLDLIYAPCTPVDADVAAAMAHEDAAVFTPEQQRADVERRLRDISDTFGLRARPYVSAYGDYLSLDARHEHRETFPAWCREPPFTSLCGYEGTLDYVLVRTTGADGLRVEAVLSVPSRAEVTVQTALPNDDYGSDHLCVGAELSLAAAGDVADATDVSDERSDAPAAAVSDASLGQRDGWQHNSLQQSSTQALR